MSDVPALGDVAVFELADARFRTPAEDAGGATLPMTLFYKDIGIPVLPRGRYTPSPGPFATRPGRGVAAPLLT